MKNPVASIYDFARFHVSSLDVGNIERKGCRWYTNIRTSSEDEKKINGKDCKRQSYICKNFFPVLS